MVFRLLDNEIIFPDTALADPDGLLAIGGDLSLERLMLAYQSGIFPWFSDEDPILWFAPHGRCVIYPERIYVSKSMKKLLSKGDFSVTENMAFASVIKNCSTTPRNGQDGTWITADMQKAYINLYKKGIAHSVEVWKDDELVGGLYGVKIGQVFCGESMFSHFSNASKIALIYLCKLGNYNLIDCQLPNDHLMSMGAEMIGREKYLGILNP